MNEIHFHGQTGEDFLLWEYFDRRSNGYYVEIGAFDGIYMSNSYIFEQQGWSGICIEPIPQYARLCAQRRPRAACLQMACVGDSNLKEVEFSVEELGVVSGVSAKCDDPGLQNTYQAFGLPFKGFEKLRVPAATLDRILEQHLPEKVDIDFISMDVEGSEMEVLRGLDLRKYGPKVLLVEANTQEEFKALQEYLCLSHDYIFARQHTWNYFFLRRDQDPEKLRSIHVNCIVAAQLHPLGPRISIPPKQIRQV